MRVRVELYGPLRDQVGEREVWVELAEGAGARHLLQSLSSRYGSRFQAILSDYTTGPEAPRFKSLLISRNGQQIASLEEDWDQMLQDGDQISLVPQIAGGV